MLEKTINELSINEIIDNLEKSLIYEIAIKNKKEQGEKLTKEEWFYDNYVIKPSTLISLINKRIGEKNEK